MIERTERLAQLLHDAILIAESSRERTVLGYLRGARLSLQEGADAASVRVDLLSGRVFAGGVPVALSRAELAVMLALSVNERGASREILVEDLYPGTARDAAANTLKVNVHRVRRRVGSPDVIRYVGGRYALGERVDVELPRLEAEVRRAQLEGSLAPERADRFERLRQRVLDGRPEFVLEWPWFDEIERRLRELGREITLLLAREALRRDSYERAIDLATELVRDDRLDEAAAEIAIRGFLLAGNRTAAVLEYRRYASAMRNEHGRPDEGLRELVEGAMDQPQQPYVAGVRASGAVKPRTLSPTPSSS